MKYINVGRSIDCDIIIPDESDTVSRQHMVIKFNPFGKMTISDKSSNGTFVNGKRITKGASIPVTRNDEVRLGKDWVLDWNLVKDPYSLDRILVIVVIILLAAAGVGFYIFRLHQERLEDERKAEELIVKPTSDSVSDDWNKDSTLNVSPTETSINVGGNKKADTPAKSRKKTTSKKVNKSKDSKSVKNSNYPNEGVEVSEQPKKSLKSENINGTPKQNNSSNEVTPVIRRSSNSEEK